MPEEQVFRPGERVRRCSSREQVGTIVSGPRRIAAQDWYAVSFGGPRVVNIPASDLELFAAGRTVEDLLREGVYATKETLSNLLTFTPNFSFRSGTTSMHYGPPEPVFSIINLTLY